MSEQGQHPGPVHDRDATGWVILGAVLIVGGFFLAARNFGLVPWPLGQVWNIVVKARFGLGIILLGVALILWAQSGKRFTAPTRGAKLYRSRSDKWLAGVLGGLAQYFGIDSTLLRLAFIALVVLFDIGGLVLVYIVLAIVVPLEPVAGQAAPAAPQPPAPVAPAPPAPETTPPPVSGGEGQQQS